MIAIPSGSAARQTWTHLPAPVRAEAVRLAVLGEAHPDPAVAAVVVGRIRADNAVRHRVFAALLAAVRAVYLGTAFALLLMDFRFPPWPQVLVPVGAIALLVAVVRPAMWLTNRRLAGPDPIAELANLRTLPPGEGVPDPLVVRRRPDRLWWSAAAVPIAIAVGLGEMRALPAEVRWNRLPEQLGLVAVLVLVVVAAEAVRRRRRENEPGAPARLPVRISAQGVRFGRLPVIAWPAVTGVTLAGPSPIVPTAPAEVVWALRDRTDVRLVLEDVDTPPEAIIAAARGHRALTPV